MSANNVEKLLAKAKHSFKTGVLARESGDISSARQAFLTASKKMMAAAQQSRGRLRESRLDLAEELLVEADALKKKQPSATSFTPKVSVGGDDKSSGWMLRERPNVSFDDVAGLENVKEQIRIKLLYPFSHPELAETYGVQPGGGILLYGPPGTGKTLIARAVAGEIEAAFFAIKPSEIMSQWVGKAEGNIAKLFSMAAELPLSVIFIDEMESLAPKRRQSRSTVMQRVVPQLLAELDGFQKRANPMLFIGATNEPWAIDSAILRPGRLDRLIYVPPPDQPARLRILGLNLKDAPLNQQVALIDIADQTQGFSGADMASVAQRVREMVFSDAIHSGVSRPINTHDFQAVLAEMSPSIPEKDLRKFDKFEQGSS
jgi:transitional endoplasmic reticulum ATPase